MALNQHTSQVEKAIVVLKFVMKAYVLPRVIIEQSDFEVDKEFLILHSRDIMTLSRAFDIPQKSVSTLYKLIFTKIKGVLTLNDLLKLFGMKSQILERISSLEMTKSNRLDDESVKKFVSSLLISNYLDDIVELSDENPKKFKDCCERIIPIGMDVISAAHTVGKVAINIQNDNDFDNIASLVQTMSRKVFKSKAVINEMFSTLPASHELYGSVITERLGLFGSLTEILDVLTGLYSTNNRFGNVKTAELLANNIFMVMEKDLTTMEKPEENIELSNIKQYKKLVVNIIGTMISVNRCNHIEKSFESNLQINLGVHGKLLSEGLKNLLQEVCVYVRSVFVVATPGGSLRCCW